MKKPSPPLREGFTTGTAATAAAMAALHCLLHGESPHAVRVPLPPFALDTGSEEPAAARSLLIPVLRAHRVLHSAAPCAEAEVEKDGGDDPDATRHAHIIATLRLHPAPALSGECDESDKSGGSGGLARLALLARFGGLDEGGTENIVLEGGAGVGRVTLPGLGLPVGAAAINPVPRQQICAGLRALARACGYRGGMEVTLSVPGGEALARHTLNSRLGIVGGISILGTQGTVKPFSHAAWQATIVQGLEVARQTLCPELCLSTGRRSEKLLMAAYPHLPAQAFIQAADFVQFSLQEAGARPFSRLVWGCFFGKLLKLAEGHGNTHAREATLDMRLLSRCCAAHGAACTGAVALCLTAGQALECLLDDPAGQAVLHAVAHQAALHAQNFAGRPVRIHLFHIQGQELLVV